jgi:hypothetical protein
LRRYHDGALIGGGDPILPVFPVTCNVCGNTVFFNALKAGAIIADNVVSEARAEHGSDEAIADIGVSSARPGHSADEEIHEGSSSATNSEDERADS